MIRANLSNAIRHHRAFFKLRSGSRFANSRHYTVVSAVLTTDAFAYQTYRGASLFIFVKGAPHVSFADDTPAANRPKKRMSSTLVIYRDPFSWHKGVSLIQRCIVVDLVNRYARAYLAIRPSCYVSAQPSTASFRRTRPPKELAWTTMDIQVLPVPDPSVLKAIHHPSAYNRLPTSNIIITSPSSIVRRDQRLTVARESREICLDVDTFDK